ncbi:bifunctional [glutamate--ammonia ligase]-adenylyl-L-tyrosine phosphorylase/[glutamate--ammonia-ligase] adenylyltransferase [Altererythrobacter sp. ZODW24]|uniref:bifunctional [glutamate--ammonia ligase]-adenylyl-L-tyrosine phosphorylase/[glutamate--ammonia-ligase] adenylyltransferase n=1 Tax=Altererythrobacter sp. ZODW24 TaxID=2185142 RepID=UPI000DF7F5F8|nr:bifunctional [glutamate--ammonia ligase]-adenylyl-L-tyrosine phosphorylase/[glutamate--ammonia-ligase] adenylyltransferase [Altererythrobacter sp. ZODW24]
MKTGWQNALERARAHSPFLCDALAKQADLTALLEAGDGGGAMAFARQAGAGTSDVGVALRREKLALATTLAIGDLAGAFDLTRVMDELSSFADRALDAAINAAILKRMPDAEPRGFVALALGKHGARELNYSSDIDPILLYDPDTLPRRERDDPAEIAQRYARQAVQTMSAQTAEGYVFRVDLMLRPASEVSPPALSCAAALTHYESSALAWERAAFIRSRSASGDVPMGSEFLGAIRSFIWRRNLDFGAIEEIGRLTTRIRDNHDGPREPGPGYDVKRGRGGIREVEFFAQTHQLIHGGRDPSLRVRGTRAALDALADAGRIKVDDALLLGNAYDRLREIEHRLQMVADRQTHALPEDPVALDSVAQLDGLANGKALVDELRAITDAVGSRFDSLVDVNDDQETALTLSPRSSGLAARLNELSYADPKGLAKRIGGWSNGKVRALRSEAARAAFDAVLPALLAAFADAPDPTRALLRWENLLVKLPSAVNLFRLLEARPALIDQLASVLTLSPVLADELGRRPELLDRLIDHSAFDLPGDASEIAAKMARRERGDDYEHALDRIRIVTGETRFALGVQLIEAANDPLAIGDALSRTAEAALEVAAHEAESEFAQSHGRIPGASLVVIGLGRFGGGSLTHASDLDVIFTYDGDQSAESDGERPLGATLYFNRLAQRVIAALSVPTAEGALYEVDTRLRPQGAQGPLAVSLDAFARYQHEEAWTWEHMALTRARALTGPPEARAKLDKTVSSVLHLERDPGELKAEVLRMRAEMAAHKTPRGPLDVKLHRGGLIDFEFMVHYLQLRERTALSPNLAPAIAQLAEQGLLPESLRGAYDLMTRMLVAVRLLAPDAQDPPAPAQAALARACGHKDYASLLKAVFEARHGVAQTWADIFGATLEIGS